MALWCRKNQSATGLKLRNHLRAGKPQRSSIPAARSSSSARLGREGVRCAIEDMTEPRLLVLRD